MIQRTVPRAIVEQIRDSLIRFVGAPLTTQTAQQVQAQVQAILLAHTETRDLQAILGPSGGANMQLCFLGPGGLVWLTGDE